MHAPPRRHRAIPSFWRRRALSWAGLSLAVAALAAGIGLHLVFERSREHRQAQARIDVRATAVANYLDQVVGAIGLVLETVDDGWARLDYARVAPAMRPLLADRMEAAPAIADLSIVDANGILLFGGRGERPDEQRLDLSWREWFQRPAASLDPRVVISEPLQPVGAGAVINRRIVPLSHGVRDPQGRLRGVAVLSLDPNLILDAAASLPGMEQLRLELLVTAEPFAPPIVAAVHGSDIGAGPNMSAIRPVVRSLGALSIRLSAAEADVDGAWIAHTLLPDVLLGSVTLLSAGACLALVRGHRRRVGLMRATALQMDALCDAAQIGFFRLAGSQAEDWAEPVRAITGVPSFAAFGAMLSVEDRAALEAMVLASNAHDAPRNVLVSVAHPDRGPRRMRVQLVAPLAKGDPVVWGYVRDETDLMAQLEDAAQQQRMDILGSLTAGVAHDFNNLLCALSLTLEAVRTASGNAAPASLQVDQAQRLVDRGADLTAQLLAYARRQPLRRVSVGLEAFFNDAARVMRQTLGPQHPLHAEIAPNLGHGELDPALLQTVLVRLALNAREAMPLGGTVSLEVGRVTLGVRESLDLGAAPGPYVRVCVADHGAGMDDEHMAHAFDPFREPARLAVGLGGPVQAGSFSGLPMVYGFALQAGGAVHMHSGVEDGTQVVLYLPLPAGAAPPSPAPASSRAPQYLPLLRVLLIEDDPDLRDCTRALLEQQGATVTALADGLSAVARLGDETFYDLLLSDVVLPGGVSGFDIVDGARRIRPALPALLMSGYAAPERELGRERPERTALLQKPFSSVALIAAIQDTLHAYGVEARAREDVAA